VNFQDSNGSTALHKAAASGDETIAQLLLNKGASVATADKLGQTPLHLACIEQHDRIARILVESNADINAKDSDGNSPLDLCPYERLRSILKGVGRE
jgi:ankyrin repeat protein